MRKMMKKYRILILAELLLFLLSLSRCFVGEDLVYTAQGEEAGGGNFSLSPGVYQMRVVAEVPQDASVFVTVEAEGNAFQSLRCNGMAIRPDQKYVDFEIYVLDEVENAHIVCGYENTDGSAVVSMKIVRTCMGERMLCFGVFVGSILLNAIILYREKVAAGKIGPKEQRAFWVLALCVALACLPYATDYFSLVGDSYFHMLRIEGLKETLMHGGQFPVRIQGYWLYEHGYAVSAFYGDLLLIVPAALRLIGFSLMTSYKLFVLMVTAATAKAAYYSLKTCTKNASAALFGSVLYILAPYRVYNFYNRVAVGEYLAMVFIPLVICGMYRLYTEEADKKEYSGAKVPLIIGLSGILQCHLLTCEMTVAGIALVCLLKWKRTFDKRIFVQLLQAAGICLLLNCWFWLPLLQMMGTDAFWFHDLVNHDIQSRGTWPAGIVQLWPNMGGSQTGMYNCEPIQIGAACLVLLGVFWGLCLKMKKGISRNPYGKAVLFFASASTLLVIMGTNVFPWDFLAGIPGIRFPVTALQFPSRMLSPASASCAFFASFLLLWAKEERFAACIEEHKGDFIKGMYCAVLLLAVFSEVFHVNSIALQSVPVRLYNAGNIGFAGALEGGYPYLLDGADPNEYRFHDPVAGEGLEWHGYSKEGTNLSVYVANHTAGDLPLELPVIGYKGYGIEGARGESGQPYIAGERGSHGDLKVVVPAGYSGEIRISYMGFASFRAAEVISLVTVLCIGVWGGRGWTTKIKRRHTR